MSKRKTSGAELIRASLGKQASPAYTAMRKNHIRYACTVRRHPRHRFPQIPTPETSSCQILCVYIKSQSPRVANQHCCLLQRCCRALISLQIFDKTILARFTPRRLLLTVYLSKVLGSAICGGGCLAQVHSRCNTSQQVSVRSTSQAEKLH